MSKHYSKLSEDFGIAADELKQAEGEVIPAWSPSVNWATCIGGFKCGKISVMYGPESAGKSLMAMMAIIEMQRRDPEAIALWFDAEFSFNVQLFMKLGGDAKRLRIKKTNDPVKIFDFIGTSVLEAIQEGYPIRAMVVDTIKAIRYPKESNKKLTTDMTMGGTGASYLPGAIKLILPIIAEHNIMTIFVQQVTMQIDPMKALRNPYVLTEGMALKHCADIMMEIIKLDTKAGVIESGETIAGGTAQVGHKVRVKVKKNRMGAPARVAQFSYHYDKGIVDTASEIFELGKSLGVIFHPVSAETGRENSMMWQFANYDPIRGEANLKAFVLNSKKVQDEILEACYKHQDAKVELDADGVAIDDPADALNVDLDG